MIVALFLVIFAVFIAVNELTIKHYDDGEIYFDYPQNWQIKPGSNPSVIAAFFDPYSGLNVTVNKQVIPPGYKYPENFILNTTESVNSGFKLTSHRTFNLNGNPAYENIYCINSKGNLILRKEIWLPKNGNIYSIIYSYNEASIKPVFIDQMVKYTRNIVSGNQTETHYGDINPFNLNSLVDESITSWGFGVLIKDFNVYSISKPANTPFWAGVSIPAINVSWGVRPDTVNGYNSVYHYNESFYPVQIGTVGLLGHHTLYSAPFNKIDQLKPGDKVVVDDYLSQERYIYQVVSNGDIKWDYQINPIKFPGGSSDLTLVTCYPPGTTDAAWMVHCKLISIKPL